MLHKPRSTFQGNHGNLSNYLVQVSLLYMKAEQVIYPVSRINIILIPSISQTKFAGVWSYKTIDMVTQEVRSERLATLQWFPCSRFHGYLVISRGRIAGNYNPVGQLQSSRPYEVGQPQRLQNNTVGNDR